MELLRKNQRLVLYNIKILANLNMLVAFVLALIVTMIFDLQRLTYQNIAIICELYLSILGILLIPFIANIENVNNTFELTYVRKISYLPIFVLRLLLSFLLLSGLALGIILVAKIQNGNFPFLEILSGTLVSAVYLGLIGLTVANISGNTAAGYLISFAYYAFEYSTKGFYTKDFFIFSLLKNSFSEKYNILMVIVVLLVVNVMMSLRKSTQL